MSSIQTISTPVKYAWTGEATSTSTGSLIIVGGICVGKKIYTGDNVHVNGTLNAVSARLTSTLDSTDSNTGALIIDGGMFVRQSLNVLGSVDVQGTLIYKESTVTSTDESTSITTGALKVAGGAGIIGNVYIGKDVHITGILGAGSTTVTNISLTDTTESTNVSTGTLKVSGGVGILRNLNVGGNETVTGTFNSGSGTITNLSLTDTTESTDISTGTLKVSGGVGILRNLNVGGNETVTGTFNSGSATVTNLSLTDTTESTDVSTGTLKVSGGVGILRNLNVAGDETVTGTFNSGSATVTNLSLTDTTESTDVSTGTLKVSGGVGILRNLNVAGDVSLTNCIINSTDNATDQYSGALQVTGGVGINGDLYAAQNLCVNGGYASTSTDTGTIRVNGGVGITDSLYVGQDVIVNDQSIRNNFKNIMLSNVNQDNLLTFYSPGTVPESNTYTSVCYSPQLGMFVAVGYTNSYALVSIDGKNWNTVDIAVSGARCVIWIDAVSDFISQMFVAVGTNCVSTSLDGITWTDQSSTSQTGNWNSVCWSPGSNILVAVATSGTELGMYSWNGITWNYCSGLTSGTPSSWNTVCYSRELSKFFTVSSEGYIATSTNGMDWNSLTAISSVNSICWCPEISILVAVGNNNIITSSDSGITWKTQTSPSLNWQSIIWLPSYHIFIGCGSGGSDKVMYSFDAISWTTIGLGTADGCYGSCYSNTLKILAITQDGDNGILVSTPIPEKQIIMYTADSSNSLTGSLAVYGGVGISKKLFVGDDTTIMGTFNSGSGTITNLSLTDTTESTDISTGTLKVSGGVGIKDSIHIGNSVVIYNTNDPSKISTITTGTDGTFLVNGNPVTIDPTAALSITNTTESTDSATGAFKVSGGVGILRNLNVGGNEIVTGTFNSGSGTITDLSLTATTESTDISTGTLKVAGGVGILRNLNVGGNETVTGTFNSGSGTITDLSLTATTESTDISTGTLKVSGGVGILRNLNVGGNEIVTGTFNSGSGTITDLSLTATTESTDISTGTLKVAGGVGILRNLNVGGNEIVTGTFNSGSGTITDLSLTATTESTDISTGTLKVSGGVGIRDSIHVGNSVVVYNTSDPSKISTITTGTDGTFLVNGNPVTVDPAAVLSITNTTESTDATTGAFKVSGGVGILRNLNVGGNETVTGTFNSGSGTITNLSLTDTTESTNISTGTLKVSGGVGILRNLNVGGNETVTGTFNSGSGTITNLSLTDTTESTNISTGTLKVAGGVGILRNLNVGGNTNVTTSSANQLSVGYDNSNKVTFNVSSSGDLTIDASGNDLNLSSTDVVRVLNTSASSSTSTGGLIVSGGLSVARNIFSGRLISANANLSQPIGTINTYIRICSWGQGVGQIDGTSTNVPRKIIFSKNEINYNMSYVSLISASYIGPPPTYFGKLTYEVFNSGVSFRVIAYADSDNSGHLYVVTNNYNFFIESAISISQTYALLNPTECGASSLTYPNDLINQDNPTLIYDSAAETNSYNIPIELNSSANIITNPTMTVNIRNTIGATSTSTGSLVVDGGVGIAKNLYVGGNEIVTGTFNSGSATVTDLSLTATTESTNISTGTLKVAGGVGILRNLNVGGNETVTGTFNSGSGTITDLSLTATTESTNISTGTLKVSGGVGILRNLNVGGNETVTGTFNSGSGTITDLSLTATTESTNISTGSLKVSGGVGIAKNMYVGGIEYITNASASTSVSTGALVVSGGAGIGGKVIAANADITGTLKVDIIEKESDANGITFSAGTKIYISDTTDSGSAATGACQISGGVSIANQLYVGGKITSGFTNVATSTSTGSLVVNGGVGIAKNMYVGGNTEFRGNSTMVSNAVNQTYGAQAFGDYQGNGSFKLWDSTSDVNLTTGWDPIAQTWVIQGMNPTVYASSILLNPSGGSLGGPAYVGTGGQFSFKNILNATWYAKFYNATSSDYIQTTQSNTATIVGTVAIVGNKLSINAASSATYNSSDSGTVGSIKFMFTPSYTGAPGAEQVIVSLNATASANAINLYHNGVNQQIYMVLKNSVGGTVFNDNLGSWIQTSGTEYEFELCWNAGSNNSTRLFIDGVLLGTATYTAYTRTTAEWIGFGSSSNLQACLYRNAIIYSNVQHTAGYTPGYSLFPPTFYTGTAGVLGLYDNTTLQQSWDYGQRKSQITYTTQSTSTSTGALQVLGGVGIAKNLYVGGIEYITNTTQSTNTSTGSLLVSGGVGITGALNIGNDFNIIYESDSTKRCTLNDGSDGYLNLTTNGLNIRQVNIPSGATFYASGISKNADYSAYSIYPTQNDATVVNGKYLDVYGSGFHTWPINSSIDGGATGTINVRVTPFYSGAPSANVQYILFYASSSILVVYHEASTGNMRVMYNYSTDINLGVWSQVSGTEYELELNWTTGTNTSRLFINGTQFGSAITISRAGVADAGIILSSLIGTHIYYRNYTVYKTVQHTTTYTPIDTQFSYSIAGNSSGISVNITTSATSTSTGALIVSGGAGIGGNLYVGGSFSVAGALTYTTLALSGTTDSTSITNGTLIVSGGVGIAKKLNVGDTITTPILAIGNTTTDGIKINTTSTGVSAFGWRDLIGEISVKGDSSNPTWQLITTNVGAYGFIANDRCDLMYHIPHDYVSGSDLYLHTHWCHNNTAISGFVRWNAYVIYAKGFAQAAFNTSEIVIPIGQDTPNTTSVPRYYHMVTESQLSAAGGLISSSVNISITATSTTLTAASSLFSQWEVGRTVRIVGAGPAGGNLNTTITAWTSTTQVTLGNAASTTVTAQPNYQQRVLDSNSIEVDGMVATNVVMLTRPTMTGGTNVIFVFTMDIHYQSTGIPTKNKAPNFYT